jgi:hypothetical protein
MSFLAGIINPKVKNSTILINEKATNMSKRSEILVAVKM